MNKYDYVKRCCCPRPCYISLDDALDEELYALDEIWQRPIVVISPFTTLNFSMLKRMEIDIKWINLQESL